MLEVMKIIINKIQKVQDNNVKIYNKLNKLKINLIDNKITIIMKIIMVIFKILRNIT